jgi:uridine kinase
MIVGLAGGTGAGKSLIARSLVAKVGGCLIDLESYHRDRSGLTLEGRHRASYEEPATIDDALLLAQLEQLARGEPVRKPVYSFDAHAPTGSESIAPARLMVVEGLFTLWWEALRSLLDVKVFVDAPPDLRLMRRIRRDIAERGRTLDQVLHHYTATTRPMHARYVEPTRAHADLVVINDGPIEDAVELVIATLRRRKVEGLAGAAAPRP